MDEAVASAIGSAFSGRTVDDVGSAGPSWNENNRTVRVAFADGSAAYLKVAVDGVPSRIARERATLEYVDAHCAVAVPAVLASDVDGSVPYLATSPLSGTAVADRWEEWDVGDRAATARLVGRTLADLHRIRFEDHGRIAGDDAGGLAVEATPWADHLVATIGYVRELATAERFDRHFDDAIELVEANRDRLTDVPAVLVHGDVTRGNCFRREDGVGLLDWEDAHAGDPVREIRRTRRQLIEPVAREPDEAIVGAFHDGYRDRAGALPDDFDARAPIYAVVSFLDVSGFFDAWAPDADGSTDELAAWVADEMDRRLAAA